MPEASYKYTGTQTLGYFSYVDTSTQHMLVADPGESYGIRATEQGLAVPPPDGRWTGAEAPAAPVIFSPPPDPDPEPVPSDSAEPEGSEA